MAAADQLRLRLTSTNSGVQFLQLLEPRAHAVTIAYAAGTGIELSSASAGVAANVSVVDGPTDLALMYLQSGRIDDAMMVLEFRGPLVEQFHVTHDVAAAVVMLQVALAAGRPGIGEIASNDYVQARDPGAASKLHRRLQELAPRVDVASRLLVIRAAALERPAWETAGMQQNRQSGRRLRHCS